MRDEAADLGSNFGGACLVPPEQRLAHINHALDKGLPEIQQSWKRQKGNVAIVATGPSAKADIDRIKAWDGPIWAINGALGFLIDHGITPDAWVSVDPLPEIVSYLDRTPELTHYYPASVCHPKVIDRLVGLPRVSLWHPMLEIPLPSEMMQIGGGPTSATRAPMLARALGFNRVTLFGVDSSWDDDAVFHSDGRALTGSGRLDDQPITVEFNGRSYRTSRALLNQATYLGYLKQRFNGRLDVMGSGLGPDIVRNLRKGMH